MRLEFALYFALQLQIALAVHDGDVVERSQVARSHFVWAEFLAAYAAESVKKLVFFVKAFELLSKAVADKILVV